MDFTSSLNGRHAEVGIDISDCFDTIALDLHHGETMYRNEEGEMLPPDEQEPLVHFELGTQCCHSTLEIMASPAQMAQVAAKLVTKLSQTHSELMLAMLDFSQWEESAPEGASAHIVTMLFSAGNPNLEFSDEDRFEFYDQLVSDATEGNEMVVASLAHAGIEAPYTRETIDSGIQALWGRWKHVVEAINGQRLGRTTRNTPHKRGTVMIRMASTETEGCRYDSDGDGNCHLCAHLSRGCFHPSQFDPEPYDLWSLVSDYFDDNEDPSPRHVLFLIKEWAQAHPSEFLNWLELPDRIGPKSLQDAIYRHIRQEDTASGALRVDATGADQPARTLQILPGRGY